MPRGSPSIIYELTIKGVYTLERAREIAELLRGIDDSLTVDIEKWYKQFPPADDRGKCIYCGEPRDACPHIEWVEGFEKSFNG